jgi:hypothetical protein
MRQIIYIPLVVFFLMVMGCSGGGNVPTTSQSDTMPEQMANVSNPELVVLNSGTMNLDTGTIEAKEHSASAYYDVTSHIDCHFSFTVDNFIAPDTYSVTLRIENTSSYTAYDVCIVFEYLFGKTVKNPDSYMNIFEPWDLDPYIAFCKETANRQFPPGMQTEELLITYTGESNQVDYFIIADVIGNTGGVLGLTDWDVSGQLTPDGGNATIQVTALDHQADVTSVRMDTTALTGGITDFDATPDPLVWSAEITNSELAPQGVYTIPVMAVSPAEPIYNTYNFFKLFVVAPGDVQLETVEFYEKPIDDVWIDVGVEPDGFVYVVADHPATGNVGGFPDTGSRTCLKFTNNLDTMVVLNEGGSGMNDPSSAGWIWNPDLEWDRVDVSEGGSLLTNVGGSTLATWTVSGNIATNIVCCWQYTCAGHVGFLPDLCDINPIGYEPGLIGFGRLSDKCTTVQNWTLSFEDKELTYYSGFNSTVSEIYPPVTGVVGIDGLHGTQNILIFFSSDTEGKLSVFGDCFIADYNANEISSVGSYGVGSGEFVGGLDMSINSEGYIYTLEDIGGTYRFQKFDSDLNWVYVSSWVGEGEPLRMDFDTADDQLYLVSTAGLHLMDEVE